jgi:adenylate cyclase
VTEFRERRLSTAACDPRRQPWAHRHEAGWGFVSEQPQGKRAAIARSGAIEIFRRPVGTLAVMIELSRLSRYLGGLELPGGGAAFILASDGSIVADPDPEADERRRPDLTRHPLLPLVTKTGLRVGAGEASPAMRIDWGAAYDVDLMPLGFLDWRLAVIVPEEATLGPIRRATDRLALALGFLVLLVALAAVGVGERLVGRPLREVARALERVERFDLDAIVYRPSRLRELDALSRALMRMAGGLAAFERYLPRDIVRLLAREGVAARPGGEIREVTCSSPTSRASPGLRSGWVRTWCRWWGAISTWSRRRWRPRAAPSTSISATRSWPSGARRARRPIMRCAPAGLRWRRSRRCAPRGCRTTTAARSRSGSGSTRGRRSSATSARSGG